eukprot:scaffold305_cov267-Chaetoceros_neogracile.AAC.3
MQIGKHFFSSKFHKKKARNELKDGTGTDNMVLTTMPSKTMTQKPKRGRWKCVHDDASNRVYYYHTLNRKVFLDWPSEFGKQFHSKFHQKKTRNELKDGTSTENMVLTNMPSKTMTQKPKCGRWKCVHDDASNRVYYYHTCTKKVSWDRPSGFVEWRISHDMKQRQFFYNVITKETMWETPDDLVVW